MANVVSNPQVAHIWAHQSQDTARSHNGNFSFHGEVIYSYSTPVARIVRGVIDRPIALVTSRTYSTTTSGKHIGPIYRALDYGRSFVRVFTVPFIGAFGGRNSGDRDFCEITAPTIHQGNVDHYVSKYNDVKATLPRRTSWQLSHTDILAALNEVANNCADYCEAFGIDCPAFDTDADAAAIFAKREARNTPAAIAKREAAAATRKAAADRKAACEAAARIEREAARRAAFYAGERLGYGLRDANGGALLRVMGDTLQTSLGAEVPLAHAVKAFRFVKLCRERGEAWHRNGRTIRVGHFQVDRIAPDGDFWAGCHRINWAEVERLASDLGLSDAAPSADAVEPSARAA